MTRGAARAVEGDAPAPATTGRGRGRGHGAGRGNGAAVALQRPTRRMPTPRGRRRGTSWQRDASAGLESLESSDDEPLEGHDVAPTARMQQQLQQEMQQQVQQQVQQALAQQGLNLSARPASARNFGSPPARLQRLHLTLTPPMTSLDSTARGPRSSSQNHHQQQQQRARPVCSACTTTSCTSPPSSMPTKPAIASARGKPSSRRFYGRARPLRWQASTGGMQQGPHWSPARGVPMPSSAWTRRRARGWQPSSRRTSSTSGPQQTAASASCPTPNNTIL